MCSPTNTQWDEEDFSMTQMTELARAGAFPEGYLDAWGDHLRGLSAKLEKYLAETKVENPEAKDMRF